MNENLRYTFYTAGYHGGSNAAYNDIIKNGRHLFHSIKSYDWLGIGSYYWEKDVQRAAEWAKEYHGEQGKVIGAVIDLFNCFDLTVSTYINEYILHHLHLELQNRLLITPTCESQPPKTIENKNPKSNPESMLYALRYKDHYVLETLHQDRKEKGLPSYDAVRAAFYEGSPVYNNTHFHTQTHIQICVRNNDIIVEYFSPIIEDLNQFIEIRIQKRVDINQ